MMHSGNLRQRPDWGIAYLMVFDQEPGAPSGPEIFSRE